MPEFNGDVLQFRGFNGDVLQFREFWDLFSSSVGDNLELSDIDKFSYLRGVLKGTALDLISGLTLSSSNYRKAVEFLHERFGNRQTLITKHLALLATLPPVEDINNVKLLRTFFDKLETSVRNLTDLGKETDSYGSLLISIIFNRIPEELQILISRRFKNDDWNLDDVIDTFKEELHARERCNAISHKDTQNITQRYTKYHTKIHKISHKDTQNITQRYTQRYTKYHTHKISHKDTQNITQRYTKYHTKIHKISHKDTKYHTKIHKISHKDTQNITQRYTKYHTKIHKISHKDTQNITQRYTKYHTKIHKISHKDTQNITQRYTKYYTKTHKISHKDTQKITQRYTKYHTKIHKIAHKDTQNSTQ